MSRGKSANHSSGGDVRRAFLLAIAALLISASAGAQSDTSSDADSLDSVFRGVIDSVAAVAGYWMPRVDAEDANERAAAGIMESIGALFHHGR